MFGLSAPLSKRLLDVASPLFLAGLLYLGAGLFLTGVRAVTRSRRLPRALELREFLILGGVVLTGGLLAPPLLLWGLARGTASGATSSAYRGSRSFYFWAVAFPRDTTREPSTARAEASCG
jgi:hypothetical protein